MAESFLDFNPDLYQSPDIYYKTLERTGVTGIGAALDLETLHLIEQRALDVGKRLGVMTLARKELDASGKPILDWFPIYTDQIPSIVGKYMFEERVVITSEQVEQAEAFVFTRPEFANLSEENRSRNVVRLSLWAAINEDTLRSGQSETISFGSLIGFGSICIKSTIIDGVVTHDYTDIERDD